MGVATGDQTRLERVRFYSAITGWKALLKLTLNLGAFSQDVYAVDLDTVKALSTGGLATDIGGAVEEIVGRQGGFGDLQEYCFGAMAHIIWGDPLKRSQIRRFPSTRLR